MLLGRMEVDIDDMNAAVHHNVGGTARDDKGNGPRLEIKQDSSKSLTTWIKNARKIIQIILGVQYLSSQGD